MEKKIDFEEQFNLAPRDYLDGIDVSNWLRYYAILKEAVKLSPKSILEIGAGNEVVKNCLKNFVENYQVLDINAKLKPDILADSREFRPELKGKFDCLICADVLEHMPFSDLEKNLANIFNYLERGGNAIVTIPQKKPRVLVITPLSYQNPLIIELPSWMKGSLKSFYKQVIKKQIIIDPHHCWEIGDGKVKRGDVEGTIRKTGFKIVKLKKLLYVDLWVLNKE